ncbi:hypothetical protein P7F70_04180 [Streptococcus pluranimalium]|uniref:hypothetical protein n=1 Tax=Streptococcus pluranimalium TaxID=82348 RepID=UPI0024153B4A|nr:hypothetical protein [Streptococcus pluranimalium]WFM80597.1 hypothetical protein P7F70_04180 [Streptococcus pluranimalium]
MQQNPISPKVNNPYGKVVSAVLPKVASVIDRVGNFGNVAGNLVTNAKFLKALPYGIGSAIDFSSQLLSGEDPGDAAVKTALHLGVAVGAAILLPETLLVTAGVVATNMVIDYVWDNKDDIGRKISKGISKASETVGDAISSFGKGVLSAFS